MCSTKRGCISLVHYKNCASIFLYIGICICVCGGQQLSNNNDDVDVDINNVFLNDVLIKWINLHEATGWIQRCCSP